MKSKGSMWLNSAGRYLSRPRDVVGILQARLRELRDRVKGINPPPPPPITTATSPLVATCERYRKGFLNRIVPWQKIEEASWEKFPYHIDEHDKNLLMECMSTRLNPKIRTRGRRGYGSRLDASSGRILLQSMPGTEVYRYKLVRTLARSLQVPLLELQTHDLPPYVFQDRIEQEESMSEDEIEDEDDDDDDDDDDESDDEDEKTACRRLREGDRVKYVGPRSSIKVNRNRKLSSGQQGEVREVKRDKIAVIFYTSDEKGLEPPVHWLNAKDIKRDHDALTHDCYLAMEVLCEVLESHQSIIVYFSDPFCWLSSESSCSTRNEFFIKVKEMFDQLSKCKVLICGQDKSVAGLRDVERNLEELNKGPTITVSNDEDEMRQLFTNVVYVTPIKEKKMFETFRLQLIEDNKAITLRRNFTEMHTVLKENDIMCNGLESIDTKGLILNKMKAEKIVGWATNHYLSTCDRPSVKDVRLHVPAKSVEFAISRIRKQESAISRLKKQNMKAADSKKEKKSPKDLAEGEFEKTFISAVVTPGETGVKFKDVGALEDVKKTLKELVILPLKRPQLFSRGNLLQPCQGLLLFGPPGTGKTLIAKALATESGANFININPSSISSRWFGVEEKLVKALFSFAGKLAPAIIFLDEIDALLGGRGGLTEHEGTRRMRNEFMSAWDGLRSKGSQRILVIGATNRPFDLDDAVIRRMPRRIYVELPDVENRLKILKIILAKESLEPGFGFEQLAQDTDGYSGSDLKNLCSAAAYRPVQELLENEKNMGDDNKGAPTLRPLTLDDFIQSKAKVGKSVAYGSSTSTELRKWNDEYGEKSTKNLAEGDFERSFVSAVVTPGETGVKFDDVGALEDVKKALEELVILPLKRPQLFSRGNLLQPCKGLLLFGPPGTGKTLIAKALATEAGANFISITPSSLASKWLGDEEKLAKALFSFAGKLAPVIIFLDEIDALLGARGGHTEHEATRRMRNEFMAAWDGLRSKGSQRILVIGATNRPFDLDDAVIRRMPRRIYVDLPNVENRLKILKIILAKESLEPGFDFEQLAQDTDGYSGSDLKNLCVAAAYRPVQELLENEKITGDGNDGSPTLRPLKLDDFIQSKVKVGKSVTCESSTSIEMRKWNDEYGQGGSRTPSPFGF